MTEGDPARTVLTVQDDDGPVTSYEVRWKESDATSFGSWTDVALATTHTVEELANGTEYTFEVRAVNAHGRGNAALVTGLPSLEITQIPTAPQNLRVAATDSSRAEVIWVRPYNAFNSDQSLNLSKLQGFRIEVCRADSGADALWQRQDTAGLARGPGLTTPRGRIKAEWGYGLDVPWTHGLLTPYGSVELAGGGSRTTRLGWRFELGQSLSLSLAGERHETALARPEHGLMLRTTIPW